MCWTHIIKGENGIILFQGSDFFASFNYFLIKFDMFAVQIIYLQKPFRQGNLWMLFYAIILLLI